MERSPISASSSPKPGASPPVIETPALPATGNADHMIERLSPFRVPPRPNRAAKRRAARGVLTALAAALMLATALPARSHALTVFDPLNYQENLLSAARALEQINNQVRLLPGQAQVLLKMDQNLLRLGPTLSPDLQRALADVQSRLRTGEGVALQLRATEAAYERLFPKQVSAALSTDDVLRSAKSRWDEEYAALRRAALLQGQIADGIETDTRLLGDAVARSRNAAGALEVAQAGNELTALEHKAGARSARAACRPASRRHHRQGARACRRGRRKATLQDLPRQRTRLHRKPMNMASFGGNDETQWIDMSLRDVDQPRPPPA